MKYGVYSSLEYNISKQYDDLRAPFLKCKTVRDLKEALTPHVKRIAKKYENCCYGTITATADSFRNEIYVLEQAIYHISPFSMNTIDRVVEDILEH